MNRCPGFLGAGARGFHGRGRLCRGPLPSPRNSGFSLLEVLVATTLMGLVLVVLLQVLTTALSAQEASRGHIRAIMAAEKVLQEYSGEKKLAAGSFQGREGHYAYLARVTPRFEISDPNMEKRVRCFLIQVTVSWQERGKTKSLDLQTIRTVAQKKT